VILVLNNDEGFILKIFLLTLCALVLTACSKPYDKYIGYWKADGTKSPRILQIYQEDKETYLVNENIFAETDSFGNKKNATVLEKKENELAVNNGFGLITFNVSDDGKTLRIGNRQYSKISDDEAKIALDNKKSCDALRVEYMEATKSFNLFARDTEKNKQEKIKADYAAKQKTISDCNFFIANGI
jgi:hypothetical protein